MFKLARGGEGGGRRLNFYLLTLSTFTASHSGDSPPAPTVPVAGTPDQGPEGCSVLPAAFFLSGVQRLGQRGAGQASQLLLSVPPAAGPSSRSSDAFPADEVSGPGRAGVGRPCPTGTRRGAGLRPGGSPLPDAQEGAGRAGGSFGTSPRVVPTSGRVAWASGHLTQRGVHSQPGCYHTQPSPGGTFPFIPTPPSGGSQ